MANTLKRGTALTGSTPRAKGAPGLLRPLFAAALIGSLTFFGGCTSSEVKTDITTASKPLIWPSPPEPARISYVRMIEKPQDIGAGKGFFKRIAELVLGASSDNILKPYGITVDGAGKIIVADTALKRVHIFDTKKQEYSYVDEAGGEPLSSPISAAVDGDDNIYVTDSMLGKVFVFSPKGKFISGFEAGERPTGIAINKTLKTVYVSDTSSHTIRLYDLKGKLLDTIGKYGSKKGEFNRPVDIFIDKAGDLYVSDTMNYRVQILDKDGDFITMFGRQGDGTGDFGRPKGISVDRDGHIYVADALFDTVQIFDRNGDYLLSFGTLGREAGSFWLPCGMFIDNGGKIYVADSYNKRIQVFEYLGS